MIMGEEHCGPGGCKLRIAGVSKVFEGRRGKVEALEGINLNIKAGPSGCGKTTLLNIIAGLEFPSSGTVELDGVPVSGPGRDRTVMFQESALFPWLDVLGNVMFGLKLVPGLTRSARMAIAEKNLELVGLQDCMHAHIHDYFCYPQYAGSRVPGGPRDFVHSASGTNLRGVFRGFAPSQGYQQPGAGSVVVPHHP